MKRLLLRWILLAFSVYAASLVCQSLGFKFYALPRDFAEGLQLFLGVAVLSLLNATLGRIIKLVTLPLSCITLGLFSLVVNALILWVAASFNIGFRIEEEGFRAFLVALFASILISFINGVLGVFLPDDKDD